MVIRRGEHWRKLHLCVHESNSEIISASLTDNTYKDNEVFKEVVEEFGVRGIKSWWRWSL